jgi:hypothetical protein
MTPSGKGDSQTSRQHIEAESIPHRLRFAGQVRHAVRPFLPPRAQHQNGGKGGVLSFFGTASPYN